MAGRTHGFARPAACHRVSHRFVDLSVHHLPYLSPLIRSSIQFFVHIAAAAALSYRAFLSSMYISLYIFYIPLIDIFYALLLVYLDVDILVTWYITYEGTNNIARDDGMMSVASLSSLHVCDQAVVCVHLSFWILELKEIWIPACWKIDACVFLGEQAKTAGQADRRCCFCSVSARQRLRWSGAVVNSVLFFLGACWQRRTAPFAAASTDLLSILYITSMSVHVCM